MEIDRISFISQKATSHMHQSAAKSLGLFKLRCETLPNTTKGLECRPLCSFTYGNAQCKYGTLGLAIVLTAFITEGAGKTKAGLRKSQGPGSWANLNALFVTDQSSGEGKTLISHKWCVDEDRERCCSFKINRAFSAIVIILFTYLLSRCGAVTTLLRGNYFKKPLCVFPLRSQAYGNSWLVFF